MKTIDVRSNVKEITNPKLGEVVKHTGWGFESNKNYPCAVLITNGSFKNNDRVSNFWYWKRILSNGNLSKEECGYGSFDKLV